LAFAPTDTLFDTVLDFLASTPTPEQIITYQPPEALQQRLSDLLDQNRAGTLTRLYHPLRDTWDEHFLLDSATDEIQPKTAIGRVTVFLLRLNDSDRKMDRRLLIEAQRYPCGV
jgi:hypothetical protein